MSAPAGSPTRTDLVAGWTQDALASLGRLPGVSRVGLALAEGGGRRLRFTASDRDDGRELAWCHVDAYDDLPINTAVRSGRPVAGNLDELDARYATFVSSQRATPTVGVAAVPIVAGGETLGGFVLFFDSPQRFDAEHHAELQRLGNDLGATLRRAQRAQEHTHVPQPARAVPPGAVAVLHDVPANVASVGEARRFLRRTLGDWGVEPEVSYTAVLCLSELVTNAVIHADSGCAVRVLLEDDVLTVTVRDRGPARVRSRELAEETLKVHGRGLQVVEALATRWGSDRDGTGTTAWFVLELGTA